MDSRRRTVLRLAGLGVTTTLAGCLNVGSNTEETPTPSASQTPVSDPSNGADASVTGVDTVSFRVSSSRPGWHVDGGVGRVIIVDSKQRERAVMAGFDQAESPSDELEAFLADVEYATDRLLLVESMGPTGCHNDLAVTEVGRAGDQIEGTAQVRDTSSAGTACTQALVYPSVLARVQFDGQPVDAAAITVTDGSGNTETIQATTRDPLPVVDAAALPGSIRPNSDPDRVAPLSCQESGVMRHSQWYEEASVAWGDLEQDGEPALALRVDEEAYEYGDTVRFALTNVSDEALGTGNRAKYNFQVATTDGWQDVRVIDEDRHFEYTDEAINHAPGGGFEWTFELTESGLVKDTYHSDAMVCPDLQSGRYRFAYFGVLGDDAIAVAFDLAA